MTNLIQQQFEQAAIRFVPHPEGKYEFGILAEDLAKILEHSNSRVMSDGVKDIWKGVSIVYTPGGPQEMTVVWEPGVYQLLATSRKPKAEPFQMWLYEEVLPSIRKTGSYTFDLPKDYISALRSLLAAEEEKLVLAAKNEILEAQADFYADKLEEAEDVLEVYRAIASDDACLSLKQVADALKVKRMGRNNLAKYLRQKKFLIKDGAVPYRKVIEAGKAIVVTSTWEDNAGTVHSAQSVRLTFAGLSWLVKSLKKDGYDIRVTAAQIWDKYNAQKEDTVDPSERSDTDMVRLHEV